MWSVRLSAAIITIVVVGGGMAPVPPAWAAGPGETVYGDFNADGIRDAVQLGSVSPNLCSTIVQYGTAGGTLLPPIAFVYLRVGTAPMPECPDMGVAADLNGDGRDDLGIGWSRGAPAGLTFNRLILFPPTFQPALTYTSELNYPTYFGVGVFSPGAAPSPYAIGPGGIVNAIIQDGTAVPGPIRFCSVDAPTAELADWTRSGVDGVLLAYGEACGDGSSGVVRIRQNGTVQQLENDPTGQTRWTARVVDADGDGYPDVRTTDRRTGRVSHFINTETGGMFLLVRAPDANTDRVTLDRVKPLAIDVLDNDHVSLSATVTVSTPPRYGTVQVLSDRRIIYRPAPRHGRTDRFTYVVAEDGRRSSATVYLSFPE
ncbi:Ig-like domain-containing protein [Plantactinospora sp. WMMC1484]|uniref:Ig-like domain-containing protein n=1 Tax=Plantactinospora sp. WMMC1484 TaxID=3404122 RepID=UPI003BF6126D